MTLLARAVGRVPFATRLAGRYLTDPMSYVPGKPLERWLLVFDLPSRRLALSNDPHVVETVMLDRNGTFPKSTVLTALLEPLIGAGVFGQPGGPAVKETRRIYARSLAAISEERIRTVTRRLVHGYIDRWLAVPGQPIAVTQELSRLTVDVVSECTLGATFDAATSQRFTRHFFEYQKRVLPLVMMIASGDERSRRRMVREMGLHEIGAEMRNMIRQAFIAPIARGDRRLADAPFPASLAGEGRLDSDEASETRALDEIAVMLLAGHETTAASLSWLMWELASRPELQRTAAAAVDATSPAAAPPPFTGASPEVVVDALCKETLRLFPPIGFFLRETNLDVEFREKPIPAGSFFLIAPWTLHRHRKLWSDPDEFRPERWLAGNDAPTRTSYIPFGLGARVCPGARFAAVEMAEIVTAVLSHAILAPQEGPAPKPLGNLTSRPDREIYMTLETRRSTPRREGDNLAK